MTPGARNTSAVSLKSNNTGKQESPWTCELLPVKRTMKKYKIFTIGSRAAGRFLCSEKKIVLLNGRKDAQIALHTPIVVVADVIGNHLD